MTVTAAPPAARNGHREAGPAQGRSTARHGALVAGVTGLLAVLIGYPVGWLVATSVGLPDDLTLQAFGRLVADPSLLEPLVNTLTLGVACAVTTVLLGVPLAWYTAVSDGPFRRVVHLAVLATYITPPYLTAIAFTLLLSPQAGYVNQLLRAVGLGTFNIFSMPGLVLVVSLHVCSFCYLLVHDALRRIDASVCEVARTLKATPWQVLRRILLPLVMPAVTGGALLAGIIAMTEFGPQAILGTPGELSFLPTRIVSSLGGYPPRYADMAVMALCLVLFAMVGLFVQRRVLGRQSFVAVAGRGSRPVRFPLGRWRIPALGFVASFVLVGTLAPFAVLLSAAFTEQWTKPPVPGNLTLANFQAAFVSDQVTGRAVLNSLALGAAAATICVVLALLVSYLLHRTRSAGRQIPDYLASLPLGLPATVLGFGLLLVASHPPLQVLYATLTLLLMLYVLRFLPLATRATNAGMAQLSSELEDAARITGATWWGAARRVTLPLLRPTIIAAWLLVLMPSVNELGGTILLYSSGTETVSIAIFRLNDLGQFGPVAALVVVVIGAMLATAAVAQRISTRRRPARRGVSGQQDLVRQQEKE